MARPRGRRANRRRHPRCPRAQSLPQVGACARLWEAGGAGPRRGLAGRVRGARGAVGASQSAWGSPGRPSRSPRFSCELSRCGLGEGGSLFPAHLLPPVAGGSRPAASSACCRPPVAGPRRHPGQLRVAHRPPLHEGPLSQPRLLYQLPLRPLTLASRAVLSPNRPPVPHTQPQRHPAFSWGSSNSTAHPNANLPPRPPVPGPPDCTQ